MNMASYARIAGKVLSGCQRHLPTTCGQRFTRVLQFPQRQFSVKTHAAVKYTKNKQKDDKPKEERERRTENINRHKPFGLTAWKPVDDVYVTRFYPKTVFEVNAAIDMLKRFQELDFTYPKQPLYLDLKLDVKLEKKKKVDPFVSTVHLPHPFNTEVNRVLVFTENTEEVKIAQKSGAAFVGGAELVQKIMDDEVQADFYIAVPAILPKLLPLKNKLRKKFPKSKRGSVGTNIPKMLELFKTGHEYFVERDCYVLTKFATLDMHKEQILSNLVTIIQDVCFHRPTSYGPFIERAIICSATSEALQIKIEQFLPKTDNEKML